jgi:hypothetical protein
MNTKAVLAVLVLAFLPGLAMAACSSDEHAQSTMSCADGKVFDADAKACVPVSG